MNYFAYHFIYVSIFSTSRTPVSIAGKPVSSKEDKQTSTDCNTFQPAPRHSVQNNALAASEPSENICVENQSKSTSLSSLPRYTTVQAVTQLTTIYNEARVASCHSAGVAKRTKRDSRMETYLKSPCSKGNNSFINLSSDPPCVTQPKISCDQARVTSSHSAGISKHTKRNSPIKFAVKPLYSNGHKPFASLSSDLPSATQPKTLYNQARIALCHSAALSGQINHDSQAVTKFHDTMSREGQPLKGNGHKSFPRLSPDLVSKRGIKRAADDNSNILVNKRFRMERQN